MKPIVATNFLLAIIAAILLFKFYPDIAGILVGFAVMVGVGYAIWYVLFQAPGKIRKARADAKQQRDDQVLWERFTVEQKAIRKKYDPDHKWNEATNTPQEYRREIAELNERYKDVLVRRFGDHILEK